MARIVHARETRFGGYLEDYEVGDVFVHWPGKTITEADNHAFCLLTLAASPIHVDAHFAEAELPGGRNLVVGTYVYSLLVGMSVPDLSGRAIANLGVERLRHVAPMHAGDTLYGQSEVMHTRVSASRPTTGILTATTVGRNQFGTVVCEYTRSVLLPRRPGGNP
jgi:acyl dehydratase